MKRLEVWFSFEDLEDFKRLLPELALWGRDCVIDVSMGASGVDVHVELKRKMNFNEALEMLCKLGEELLKHCSYFEWKEPTE